MSRVATVRNLFAVFVVISFFYSLLFLTNKVTGPEPPFGLCVVQGAFVLACSPTTSLTALCLVSHVFSIFLSLVRQKSPLPGRYEKIARIALVGVPWLVFVILVLISLFVGLFTDAGRASVRREAFYCLVSLDWLSTFISVCAGLFAVAAVVLVIGLGVLLFMLRRRENKVLGSKAVDVSFAIRCSIFGAYLLVASSFAVAFAADFAAVIPESVFRVVSFAI
jgi:hypothetical protein